MNIAYRTLRPGEKGANPMVIYLLAYPSREAAADNKAFAKDSDWIAGA